MGKFRKFAAIFIFAAFAIFNFGCTAFWSKNDKPPPLFDELNREVFSLYKSVAPGIVAVYNVPSDFEGEIGGPNGTGILISSDGYIVTNEHVVHSYPRGESAESFLIGLFNGEEKYPAKLIGADKVSDLAVLKIDAPGPLPFLSFAQGLPKVGEFVLAVGHPFGFKYSATFGIVSGIERRASGVSRIITFTQTDAAINPGNSGGPLFNTKGEVLGLSDWIISGSNTMGFAIPSPVILEIVPELIKSGKIEREKPEEPEIKEKNRSAEPILIKAP